MKDEIVRSRPRQKSNQTGHKNNIIAIMEMKLILEMKIKSQQHPVFPSGLPSKYYPGPMLLNFSDRMRTGVFNMVWPLTRKVGKKYLS